MVQIITLPKSLCAAIIFIFCIFNLSVKAQQPTHTAKFNFIDNNINGFWEYLPRDYQVESSKKYPLLIFLHGSGEVGTDQSQATLDRVLTAGVPKLIASGNFPESFIADNITYRFIVLSPQIKNGLQVEGTVGTSIIQPSTIDAVIEYAKTAYAGRIDESRIYLAGLSMGGGAIWDYAGSGVAAAKKIAGVVIAAGAGDLNTTEANNIAAANLPILATHNNVDDIVSADRTRANIQKILSYSPTIDPVPQAFFWNTPGAGFDGRHNVWSRTFEDLQPNATAGGNLVDQLNMSAYDWLLQFSRAVSLPVTWEQVSAKQVNGKVAVEWSVSAERQVKQYEVESSSDGSHWKSIAVIKPTAGSNTVKHYSFTDENPFHPLSYYRIKQTDLDGKFHYSIVKIADLRSAANKFTVYPNPFRDKLEININGASGQKIDITLLSATGAVLRKQSFQLSNNESRITINDLQSLSRGIYYIVAKDAQGTLLFNHKVSKNN